MGYDLDELERFEREATRYPLTNVNVGESEWIFFKAIRNAAPDMFAEIRRLRADLSKAVAFIRDSGNEGHNRDIEAMELLRLLGEEDRDAE